MRYDFRNKEKFTEQIRERTLAERPLMEYYVNWLNTMRPENSSEYYFVDNGVDNEGNYVKNPTTDADFVLKRKGKPSRNIEIKSCKKNKDKFYIKTHQLIDYIQDDVCIVMFMGWETPDIRFTIMPPSKLSDYLANGEREKVKMWGGVECIRFTTEELEWHSLSEKGN